MERATVTVDKEFFLSFTGADRPWAEWLLAELDAVPSSGGCCNDVAARPGDRRRGR
jgi:hypothetical protein